MEGILHWLHWACTTHSWIIRGLLFAISCTDGLWGLQIERE